MKKVVIVGANGRMGKIAQAAFENRNDIEVVASVGRNDDLDAILKAAKPDIALELTTHSSVLENSWIIAKNRVRPIIGASGLKQEEIDKLHDFCGNENLGGLIIPNFSIASALANALIGKLASYFNDISIVEFHHASKKDKPSGTARYVADISGLSEEHIASIRSDGFLAKQQTYISGLGERLVIDHESFSRDSFIKGIQMSCDKVMEINELKVGLENIL